MKKIARELVKIAKGLLDSDEEILKNLEDAALLLKRVFTHSSSKDYNITKKAYDLSNKCFNLYKEFKKRK